ncbi:MAG: NUDIX hydrolase [Tepidisphaeraceae bacterium]
MSWELGEKQVIFEGRKLRLELHHLRDDDNGKRATMEIVAHPGAVVVLPLLADDNVVLIRNKRHAVNQILIELPAGTLDRNELPMNAAGRELLEETGYLAGKIQPLATFFTSPGILSEKMFAFVARDLEKKHQSLEEGEEIELLERTWEQTMDMVRHGQIADGKSIATLLLYERFFREK